MTTATIVNSYPVGDIKLGARFRKEIGDLSELAASIEDVGLLHPIVITEDGRLLAGARRLRAVKKLGWTEVPVTVAESVTDATKELLAERDENTCRLDMKPSEAARLGVAIEALDAEKRLANKRASGRNLKRGRLPGSRDSGPAEVPFPGLGRAVKAIGPAVGMSAQTYERARKVVQTADDESVPAEIREVAREAVEVMDRTGKVLPGWAKVNEAKKAIPPAGEFAKWDKSSQRYKATAKKLISRVWSSLNRFDAASPELAKMDMEVLIDNLSPAELDDMLEMTENVIKGLKTFQQRLKAYKPTEKETK